MEVKKIKKEKKKRFVNVFGLLDIESKKAKILIGISMILFVLFLVTGVTQSLQGINSMWWWVFSTGSAMVAIATLIFSTK